MQTHQIPVTDETSLTIYLKIMNAFMDLTPKELTVLELLIRLGGFQGIDTSMREEVQTRLELKSSSNLNNYIKSMKDKKVLILQPDGTYKIHERLFVDPEGITFNFLWNSPK